MEMHLNSIIVTITDSNKKSFREYNPKLINNNRKCELFIPFHSEYQIMIKNTLDKRLLAEIDIDGSNISESGLIIPKNDTIYLERFVKTSKKFKFVPSNHSDVADPSSPENGILKIKLVKEKESIPYVAIPNNPWHDQTPIWNKNRPYYTHDTHTTLIGNNTTQSSLCSCTLSKSSRENTLSFDSGATVEGSHSNQHIGSSYWNGNDSSEPIYFTFYIKGTQRSQEEEKQYQEYLKLKEKFEA